MFYKQHHHNKLLRFQYMLSLFLSPGTSYRMILLSNEMNQDLVFIFYLMTKYLDSQLVF